MALSENFERRFGRRKKRERRGGHAGRLWKKLLRLGQCALRANEVFDRNVVCHVHECGKYVASQLRIFFASSRPDVAAIRGAWGFDNKSSLIGLWE